MSKKTYIELPNVAGFFDVQPDEVIAEYGAIVGLLEEHGRLISPYGEKVQAGLFAIRLTRSRNVRVFYVYMTGDEIYGIHAYEKKSRKIPQREIDKARKIMRQIG
ncbi:MAG: type II toxin-antitoxin system RelE/ParE family toxin [Victivallales bacterium]|jgi:phage-related protein|nr:type II toxin-antitoxin system RelE/ParE family toxin [Victivallales bacterium]